MSKRFSFSTSPVAIAAVAASAPETGTGSGGIGPYNAEEYAALDMGQYRTRFPDETKNLSDEDIWNIAGSTEDDLDDDGWRALFIEHGGADEPATEDTSDGEAFKAHAIALASMSSEGMSAAVAAVIKAKEDWQGGPIKVLFALRETYGDKLSEFPVPDSEGGNNPDKFKIAVTNSKNKTSMRPTTFYTQFADNTKEGRELLQNIAWLERAIDADASKAGIPDEILAMDTKAQETLLNRLLGRRTTIRGSYKKAMKLGFKMMEVNNVAGVVADFVYVTDPKTGEDTDEVENTTKPIIVYVPANPGKVVSKYTYFSLGSFDKLKPMEAIKKGGGYINLLKTLERKAPGNADGNKTGENAPTIKTVDAYVQSLVENYRFMVEMQQATNPKDLGKLYQLLKHKDSDELAVTIVELRNYLDDVASECGLDERYTSIQKNKKDLTTRKPNPTAAVA